MAMKKATGKRVKKSATKARAPGSKQRLDGASREGSVSAGRKSKTSKTRAASATRRASKKVAAKASERATRKPAAKRATAKTRTTRQQAARRRARKTASNSEL